MICCGSSGRGPVEDVSLDQNVVRTSFSIVRASQPPARHDGTECRHFHDMTLNRPQPPQDCTCAENGDLRSLVHAVGAQGCVLPTSGRALPTAEQARAAGRAAAQRSRSLAAITNSRFFALAQKIAFCEAPSASLVYRRAGVSRPGRAVRTVERARAAWQAAAPLGRPPTGAPKSRFLHSRESARG